MSWKQYSDDGFLWFKFNNECSYNYGIVRTSDGSRFNQDLFPSVQDRTVTIPGKDGSYYFGSNYSKRDFTISYAFQELTKEQLNNIQKWLKTKEICELCFGEREEIKYMAKVTGTSSISHIPFGFQDGSDEIYYNGEGKITFTCFYPFGKKETTINGNTTINSENSVEPGEYRITYQPERSSEGPSVSTLRVGDNLLQISFPQGQEVPKKITIDSRTDLIKGIYGDGDVKICNQYITKGCIPKIPIGSDINFTLEGHTEGFEGSYDLIYY